MVAQHGSVEIKKVKYRLGISIETLLIWFLGYINIYAPVLYFQRWPSSHTYLANFGLSPELKWGHDWSREEKSYWLRNVPCSEAIACSSETHTPAPFVKEFKTLCAAANTSTPVVCLAGDLAPQVRERTNTNELANDCENTQPGARRRKWGTVCFIAWLRIACDCACGVYVYTAAVQGLANRVRANEKMQGVWKIKEYPYW